MNTVNPSRQEFADSLRRDYPTTSRLFAKFGELEIEVSSNRSDVTEALKEYYEPALSDATVAVIKISAHEAPAQDFPVPYTVKPPEAGKTKIKEEFFDLSDGRIVRKRITGMVLVFGENDNV